MSDIDKKIAEIEKSVEEHRALFLDPESRNLEYADIVWLIKKLKAYREELSECKKIVVGLDEGSVKLTSVEQQTKEAVWGEIDQLPVEMGLLSKEAVKQAIDSVGSDSIDISRQAQLKAEELSRGGP